MVCDMTCLERELGGERDVRGGGQFERAPAHAAEQLTSIWLTSHPAALHASAPYATTSDSRSYPAACADLRSQPAALASAAVNPSHPKTAKTAFTAATLFKSPRLGERAAADAMSCSEEAAALAAWMMRMQRWRVTSSAAARHTSFTPCSIQRDARAQAEKPRMHLLPSRELDLEGERPTVDRRAAGADAAACNQERLRCAAQGGGCAACARTFEVQAVVAVGRRVGPHEQEAAFERVRVATFAVGVAETAAPQNDES